MKKWLSQLFRKPQREATLFEKMLLQVDQSLLDRSEAKSAVMEGALKVKRAALRTATLLVTVGWPLLFAVFLVSFVHIWHSVARIKPDWVADLPLPGEAFNLAAGANTFLIDMLALYLVAAASAARYAGKKTGSSVAFYLLLTGLLNGSFYFRYDPEVGPLATPYLLYASLAIVALFALLIPVSIYAVERAIGVINEVRLPLMAEVTVFERLLEAENIEVEPWWKRVLKRHSRLDGLKKQLQGARDALAEAMAELRSKTENYDIISDRLVKLEQAHNKLSESLQAEVEAHGDTRAKLAEANERLESLSEELAEKTRLLAERYTIPAAVPAGDPDQPVWDYLDGKQNGHSHEPVQNAVTVALSTDECAFCGNPITNNDKSVCARVFWKERLDNKTACKTCREGRR